MNFFVRNIENAFKSEGVIFVIFLLALLFQLTDNGIYPIMVLSVGLCLLAFKYKELVDGTALLLLMFPAFLFLFTPGYQSGAFVITNLFGPFSFYLYGKYLVQRTKGNKDTLCVVVLLIVISFSFLFWKSVVHVIVTGTQEYTLRLLEFEANANELGATFFGLVASLGLSGLAIFVGAKTNWNNVFIWLFLLAFILSFLGTTTLVNRSGLVTPLIPLAVIILYNSRGHSLRTFFIISIITVIGVLLYDNYIIDSDLLSAYELRYETTQGAGGDRFWRWADATTRLFTYPFGWLDEPNVRYKYVHNLWLDIARMGGILPFITFLLATIQIIVVQLELFKIKNDDIVVILLSLFGAISSASMIEPVIEASPVFFVLYISLWGMSKEYLVESRRNMRHSAV